MTTNNYAPCPCGSGKKMKFCKCVDQPHEYETIVRLLEGGQEVAALDRINQLLTKSPNAAWLLAMKAELALNLNELDTFRETAQRFLKLKPDNPSALMMRSLVSIMDDEPVENTARTLMDSLAESRESLPALSLIVLTSLCRKLRATPKAPLRFYWFRMLQELRESLPEGEQPGNEPLATDNALAMAPIQVDAPPRSEPWFERMNEVAALESSFRFSQAETKLRSILRDYPDQLVPLVNLLRVQLVLLDQEGAANTARKLGGLRELPEERRDYYAALAMELEPGQPGIRPTSLTRYCEISSDEEVLGALAKLDGLKRMPDDESHDLRAVMAAMVKDEVPAKAAFNVLVQRTTAAGTHYRTLGGMVVVFGRQTDRPPRVLVNLFNAPDCRPAFDAINAAIGQATDLTDPGSPRRFSYIDYLLRARSGQDAQGRPVWLSPDEQDSELIEDFLNLPLPALGDISLLAAVEQEPKRAMVRAVLTHFEAAHQIRLQPGALEKLFQRLGFQRIEQTIDNQEELEKVTDFLGFMRVNVPTVSDSGLHQLLVACLELSLLRPALQAAQELLKRKHVQHPAPLLSGALGLLSQFAQTPEESLSLLEQLENCLSEQGEAVGHIVMQRFQILHSMGMAADADKLLRGALTKYPQDPYLISVMQYAMQQSQQAAGDSVSDRELLSRMTRRPESESESGLVLPGQSSPAEAGKSKLWLPGS